VRWEYRGGTAMRWVLIVYLSLAPSSTAPVLPIEIPQSTELSCSKAAEKFRDVQSQAPGAVVITSCVDKGPAY